MRPDDKRPNRLQDGKARARVLLKKNVGWLPGFPTGIESNTVLWRAWPWESPGTGRDVSLDREALRRMEMTLTKLRYHFPRALPQIVEDVDDWLARMDCLLDLLKRAIHKQRMIDVEPLLASSLLSARWVQRFRRLRADESKPALLLDAVAFLEFTGRRRCDSSSLEWIDEHATTLGGFAKEGGASRDLQLTFCALRNDIHADALPLLLSCMADARFCSVSAGNSYGYANNLAAELKKAAKGKPFKIPERPPQLSLGEALRNSLGHLLATKPKARQQATELLGALLPKDIAGKAHSHGKHVASEESRLLKHLRHIQYEGLPKRRDQLEKKRLKQAANVLVSDPDTQRLLEDAAFAVNHIPTIMDDLPHLQQWIRFASHLPPGERAIRLGLFARWEQARLTAHNRDRRNRQFRQVVSQLCRLFARRGVHQELLRHWREYVVSNRRHGDEPVNDLLDGGYADRETYRRWTRLLEATIYDRNLTIGSDLLGSLGEFVQATKDIDRASQLVAALAESEDNLFCESEIRASFAIAGEESDLAAILKKLDDDYELVEPAALLGRHIQDERLRRIIRQWVVTGNKRSLLRLASCTHLVVDLGFSVPRMPEMESLPDWLDRYPSELHEHLAALDRVARDAKAIARRLLSTEFPDPDDLQRQLTAIRQKLDSSTDHSGQQSQERLRKRFENLQGRIGQPPSVTPQRLDNLARKISSRVDHEIVERHVQDCYVIVAKKMQAAYGVRQFPEELFAPPYDHLLSGVLRLRGRMKELGLQLLVRSQRDPKFDFRNEPENARFLQTLEDKGVRLEPWFSESFVRTAKTARREPYRLFFAREILDVLLMGFHFDTCLSPGSENFFSTITNAVDINKQVVYGKTESGRVVGRCLFALADNGALLTYHRYAHDAKDGFEKECNRFADQLAKAMNTVLDSRGQVPTLLAGSWYDDGAVSSESIYDLQNPDGLVRTVLRTEDVSKITAKLLDFLGSKQALRTVLGSLAFLKEFEQRIDIVEPFLDLFGFDATVPVLERFRLAILARLAGKDESARQIVSTLRVSSLPRRLKRHECGHCSTFHGIGSYQDVLDLLGDCNPSIALRLIRLTRPKNVKSDAEETNPVRKKALMRCHQLLGRERPADKWMLP